jgi:hypothetical protein
MNVARDLALVNSLTTPETVYSAPIPMSGANALHVSLLLTSLSGFTTVTVTFWISNDGANYLQYGSSALFTFTAVGPKQATIGAGGTTNFQAPIGAVFARFQVVASGGAGTGPANAAFVTIDVNTFNT